jgi:hypothetical protein
LGPWYDGDDNFGLLSDDEESEKKNEPPISDLVMVDEAKKKLTLFEDRLMWEMDV